MKKNLVSLIAGVLLSGCSSAQTVAPLEKHTFSYELNARRAMMLHDSVLASAKSGFFKPLK